MNQGQNGGSVGYGGGRVAALDGVRALAIAPVVMLHAFGWPQGGGFGVDVFFVLSGFLITGLLVSERESTGGIALRAFYVRRARRLLPALAIMLFVYTAVVAVVGGLERTLIAVGVTAVYGMNVAISIDVNRQVIPFGLSHMWSLSAEEQFYLLWPLLLVLALRHSSRLALGLCVGLLLLAAVQESRLTGARLVFSPEGRSTVALLGGCAAAFLARSPRLRQAAVFLAPAALGPILVAMVLPHPYGWAHVPLVIAIATLVIGMTASSVLARAFSFRPLVGLGRISYSLYLWHVPVVAAVAINLTSTERGIAAVVLSLFAATASYLVIERRFLRPRVPAASARVAIASPA